VPGAKQRSLNGYYSGADFAAGGAPTGFFQSYGVITNAEGKVAASNATPNATIGLRYWQADFFVADEFTPRPNLTLTFATRYQYSAVPRDVNDRIEATFSSDAVKKFIEEERRLFNGVSGLAQFLGGRELAFDGRIFKADRNNLSPHFAFAWDPFGRGSTVVRGGYGIYYDQIPGAVTSQSRNVFPNFLSVNLLTDPRADSSRDLRAFNPAQLAVPGTLSTYDPRVCLLCSNPVGALDPVDFLLRLNRLAARLPMSGIDTFPGGPAFVLPAVELPTSYAQHWGLTLEREWPKDFLTSLAYVGTRGAHLLRFTTPNLGINAVPVVTELRRNGSEPLFSGYALPPNDYVVPLRFRRPHPLLGAISVIEADANSNYHSFQATLSKRLSRGLQFTTAYTWSHAIDEVSDFFELASGPALPQDSFDRRAERASASFDIRHSFVYSVVWDFSLAKRGKWFSGWQVASIGAFRTGQPFSLLACCDINLDGNLSDRLDKLDGIKPIDEGRTRFTAPAPDAQFGLLARPGENGALRRNIFRAPGAASIDLSIIKRFAFRDPHFLEIRTEFFNLLNRTHFGVPVHQQSFPAFGQAVDTRLPGLTVQVAAKYSF
jgi:hypothetical protein